MTQTDDEAAAHDVPLLSVLSERCPPLSVLSDSCPPLSVLSLWEPMTLEDWEALRVTDADLDAMRPTAEDWARWRMTKPEKGT